MAKILFYFCGTGDDGVDTSEDIERKNSFNDDVIRIYVRGCQHAQTGGSAWFPDMDVVPEKLNKAFVEVNGQQCLDMEILKKELGDGVCLIAGADKAAEKILVENIGLQGFSRGAVTSFAAAKKLDRLGVPLHIIANQPVPGTQSAYRKYHDLTNCRHIETAETYLVTHNMQNGLFHDRFYNQMIAKFPPETKANNRLIPHQHHTEWFEHKNFLPNHLKQELTNLGYTKAPEKQDYLEQVKTEYALNGALSYTPPEFSQRIYGADASIKRDSVYLEFIQDSAKLRLDNQEQSLTDEQAEAIKNIYENNKLEKETKESYRDFILEDSTKSKQFAQIVNKTCEVDKYLEKQTRDDQKSKKSILIWTNRPEHEKAIFEASFDYLKIKPAATDESKKTFIQKIALAQKSFETSSLAIERNKGWNIFTKAAKLIFNSILKICGIATTASARMGREVAKDIQKIAISDAIQKTKEMKHVVQDSRARINEQGALHEKENLVEPSSPTHKM